MTRANGARFLVPASGLLLTLGINFHSFLTNFNLVPGDRGDTRLVVFTLEHWFNVFKGHESFYLLNMFYPDRLALGYADGLFLFSLPYGLFRLLGIDQFSSYQLLFVFMTTLGYVTCVLLLQNALKLDPGFAVLGSILLTSLNSMQLQSDVGKLLGFYLYPALIGLLYTYLNSVDRSTWRAWLSLISFGLLLGLLFFTSYYPAWFFVFTLVLFAIVQFGAAWIEYGFAATAQQIAGFVRRHSLQLLVLLVVLAISFVPFVLTYAPLVLSDAGRSFDLVLEFTPAARDIVNVSPQNYVWGPVLERIQFKFGNREVQMGSPMLVLALFIFFFGRQVLTKNLRSRSGMGPQGHFVFILSVTAIVIVALILKYRDASLWYAVYKTVPGAAALRALGRYLMIVDMIVVVAAMYGLNEVYRSYGSAIAYASKYILVGFVVLGGGLIAEQANSTSFRLDKAAQYAFLSRYRNPVPACKAFFINNLPSIELPVGYYQLDAMMISMNLGIPTVNGYSGVSPHEVFTVAPTGPEYKYGILKWLRQNGVDDGICELDYQTGSFGSVDVSADYLKYGRLSQASHLEAFAALFSAAQRFVSDKNDLSNLYPQYLEEHGYLDPLFGFQTGTGYRWIQDKYWIGDRACGKDRCFGIGIVGDAVEVQGVLNKYEPLATRVFFPYPNELMQGASIPSEAEGQLLLVFPASISRP